MEKYGFVYLWYDVYRKMYYIGCRWGNINDGYVCSSDRMRKSYRRRPQDFKRRILKKIYTNKVDLLEEEFKWLSLISDSELGKKYYNLRKHHYGHWTNDPDKSLSISEKISKSKKGVPSTMDEEALKLRAEKISQVKKQKFQERLEQTGSKFTLEHRHKISVVQKGTTRSEESNAKRSESMKRAWETGLNKGTTGHTFDWSEERIDNHKEGCAKANHIMTPEILKNISKASKKAWAEGKFKNRRSNNMKDYIWVRRTSDGSRTRIKADSFDPVVYSRGR